jgi:GTPase Era involved in 16S rRNA processing
MIWSHIAPEIIKAPITIYKNKSLIQHWLVKLRTFAGLGKTNIVILGRTAVGKSILSSHLYGESSNISYKIPDASTDVETKAVQLGKWTEIVRVIPGHGTHERAKGLHEAFHQHKSLEGVIYVVDWGYTDVRDPTGREKLIQEDKIDTINKIREYNLKRELEDFKEILDKIQEAYSNGRAPKWLIIAVNKVDLYYDKINEAQKYYHPESNSEFTKMLNETINNIGKRNIKCISLPVCSWETNFEWNGEKIKTNLGGTEIEHALSLNFINKISEFSK